MTTTPTYDAVLLVSFGGPEGPDDVLPFLERVTAGRDVPRARLEEVAEHYLRLGGVSPINERNRRLLEALRAELEAEGPPLPVYWGNRNWHPLLPDTLRRMAGDGVRHALAFVTAAYSSYSGCRQYREDLARARQAVGDAAPTIDKIRVFYNHPLFVAAQADAVEAARATLGRPSWLVFTTHSIPLTMARHSDYEVQTREACRLVAQRVGTDDWDLVYSSRSGPPTIPWLEPDVNDHLRRLADEGVRTVTVVPIGFVSAHMEVVYDLDVEARETARSLGMDFARAATVDEDPRYVRMVGELVRERVDPAAPRRWLGLRGPSHDACPADCCLVPGQPVLPTVAQASDTVGRR